MADGISFKMVTEPFTKGIAAREVRVDRAAMWSVREAGRQVRKTSRAAAPVLKDKSVQSQSQLRRARKKGEDITAAYQKPVPGLLRASIAPSRRLKNLGHGQYSMKVGPRGQRVHLYAQKIEARAHYMAAGEAAAQSLMGQIAQRAFDRAWK